MGPRTLLVVDDDPAFLEFVRRIVEDAPQSVRCLTATDGTEALALVRSERPQLVLLDLMMPVPDGWEVARKLKADPATSATHVVAITGHVMPGDREQALATGFDDYITKPVDVRSVRELLRTYLG